MFPLVNGQYIEFGGAEEFPQCNAEAIAEFLDGYSAGVFALGPQDALDGGLGDSGDLAEAVGGYVLLLA